MKRISILSIIILLCSLTSFANTFAMKKDTINIGIVIFPGVYQLDVTGPYGVFAAASNAKVHLIWKNTTPLKSVDGLILTPTTTFKDSPKLDVICVAGGAGLTSLFDDEETISYIQEQSKTARYVTSVCAGALLLTAAGVLDGYKATTHWNSMDIMEEAGITTVHERVVVDRNRVTSAGVSAGIDMALVLVGMMWDADEARKIELIMEYDPEPPFKSGHPSTAPKHIVEQLKQSYKRTQQQREDIILKIKGSAKK